MRGEGGRHTVQDAPVSSPLRPAPLAFAGRLVPLPETAAAPTGKSAENVSPPREPTATATPASAAPVSGAPGHSASHEDADRERKAEDRPADTASKATADSAPEPVQPSPDPAAGRVAAAADLPRPVHTAAQPETRAAAAPRQAPPAVRDPAPPPAPTGPAREIRLQLAGAGQRVEVSLAERAGEVQVSVRTPDGVLAQSLRDHLPALSARLEQSGFHADSWRAGETQPGGRPADWERAAGGAQQSREHSGGHRQSQQNREQARDPRDSAGGRNRKGKGKEFAWLMSPEQ